MFVQRILQLQNTLPKMWQCYPDKICDLFNATWTNYSSKPSEETEAIHLKFVTIPDSSLEFFAQLIRKVKLLNFYRSDAQRLHLPTGLIDLNIYSPVHPIEIVINRNASYCLKRFSIVNFDRLPTQISHLHSLEDFMCILTPVLELKFELFARMENLTSIVMLSTSTKDIIFPETLQLKSLRKFTIERSFLTEFNATSWNFPSLVELIIRENNFTKLPKEFATFNKLVRLDMIHNQIEFIDMGTFADMHHLTELMLLKNHISSIVGELQLPRLTELRLDSNHLTELDVSGWYLPALTHINLGFNRLKVVTGFVRCFGRANVIHMYGGLWDCSWLEYIGRSIRGMVIGYYNETCYAYRLSMTEKSVAMINVNGSFLVHTL